MNVCELNKISMNWRITTKRAKADNIIYVEPFDQAHVKRNRLKRLLAVLNVWEDAGQIRNRIEPDHVLPKGYERRVGDGTSRDESSVQRPHHRSRTRFR